MTNREDINVAELQDRLAAKEAECRELRKELHEIRGYAQMLQNKLSVAELKYEDLQALVKGTGPPTSIPSTPDA
jgi:predicted nuclease with TOPRIM domain